MGAGGLVFERGRTNGCHKARNGLVLRIGGADFLKARISSIVGLPILYS